jgi:hypothetical protein
LVEVVVLVVVLRLQQDPVELVVVLAELIKHLVRVVRVVVLEQRGVMAAAAVLLLVAVADESCPVLEALVGQQHQLALPHLVVVAALVAVAVLFGSRLKAALLAEPLAAAAVGALLAEVIMIHRLPVLLQRADLVVARELRAIMARVPVGH